MTGTSIDGLDAALVEAEGTGLSMTARVVRGVSHGLGGLAVPLRALADQVPMTAGDIAHLARAFSLVHIGAVRELLGAERADLICVHGQTVFHKPPLSWQLMQPAPIAAAMDCPVVYDLRAADVAAGGEGAPITPLADWVLLRGDEERVVVNLGGFANFTRLPRAREGVGPGQVLGGDICACNQLLDSIARTLMSVPFDDGGKRGAAGLIHEVALAELKGILMDQRRGRRSLGTGDELGGWIVRFGERVSGADLSATACSAIGQAVAAAVAGADRVLVAGGGTKNAALVAAIASCCGQSVEPTDAYGVPAAYREAACFAVLGALCQDGVPITLPRITGVEVAMVAGAWVGNRHWASGIGD